MDLNNLFILNILNSGISLIMGFYMLFLQRNSYKLGTGYWGAGALIIGALLREISKEITKRIKSREIQWHSESNDLTGTLEFNTYEE